MTPANPIVGICVVGANSPCNPGFVIPTNSLGTILAFPPATTQAPAAAAPTTAPAAASATATDLLGAVTGTASNVAVSLLAWVGNNLLLVGFLVVGYWLLFRRRRR